MIEEAACAKEKWKKAVTLQTEIIKTTTKIKRKREKRGYLGGGRKYPPEAKRYFNAERRVIGIKITIFVGK